MSKNDRVIRHKARIPEYHDLVLYRGLRCNSSVTYPAGVPQPSLWYKADAATASVDTSQKNTITGTTFSRMWDFGTKGFHLPSIPTAYKAWVYGDKANTLDTMKALADTGQYGINYRPAAGTINLGIQGQGTVITAWHSGSSTNPNYSGRMYFRGTNGDNVVPIEQIDRGFVQTMGSTSSSGGSFPPDMTSIYGDTLSYTFSTPANTDCIRVVSVSSAGNPITYRQNGVAGKTASFNYQTNAGTTDQIIIGSDIGYTVNPGYFYEALYFETPLSLADCDAVEYYLQRKWCINF